MPLRTGIKENNTTRGRRKKNKTEKKLSKSNKMLKEVQNDETFDNSLMDGEEVASSAPLTDIRKDVNFQSVPLLVDFDSPIIMDEPESSVDLVAGTQEAINSGDSSTIDNVDSTAGLRRRNQKCVNVNAFPIAQEKLEGSVISLELIQKTESFGDFSTDLQLDDNSENQVEEQEKERKSCLDQEQAPGKFKVLKSSKDSGDIAKRKKGEVQQFLNEEAIFQDNHYPKVTFRHVARKFFRVDEFSPRQKETTGCYIEEADSKCVICFEEKDLNGNGDLMTCHGHMNGELDSAGIRILQRKRTIIPCRSRFHKKCIMQYNSGAFFFQYAARHECQAQLLCPLHCCNCCNLDHFKQSAYAEELIECVLCLRAFHVKSCYPAGGRDLDITMSINGESRRIEMMICPTHYVPGSDAQFYGKRSGKKASKKNKHFKIEHHLNACYSLNCEKSGNSEKSGDTELIKCRTCCRSFHAKCFEVETIDGQPIPVDQCEYCICGDTIPQDTPVLAKFTDNKFWLAHTRDWYKFPSSARKNRDFERLGFTVVEWKTSTNAKSSLMSILPVHDIAKLNKEYIPLAKTSALKELWASTFQNYENTFSDRTPRILKEVYNTKNTSKYYLCTAKLKRVHHTEICNCKGPNRCTTQECMYFIDGYECPPSCIKEEGGCQNRKVSSQFVNQKLYVDKTEKKGYGVFTSQAIEKDEFLCEYVGEIIDKEEKQRRLKAISVTRDFQANHYMMDLCHGFTVDAARCGNISRYINHSCDPNSGSYVANIFVKRSKNISYYDVRSYIKAERRIEPMEEITFSYNMGNEDNLPACECGAKNCDGKMGKSKMEKPKKYSDEKVVTKKNDGKGNSNSSKNNSNTRKRKSQRDEKEEDKVSPRKRTAPFTEFSEQMPSTSADSLIDATYRRSGNIKSRATSEAMTTVTPKIAKNKIKCHSVNTTKHKENNKGNTSSFGRVIKKKLQFDQLSDKKRRAEPPKRTMTLLTDVA